MNLQVPLASRQRRGLQFMADNVASNQSSHFHGDSMEYKPKPVWKAVAIGGKSGTGMVNVHMKSIDNEVQDDYTDRL